MDIQKYAWEDRHGVKDALLLEKRMNELLEDIRTRGVRIFKDKEVVTGYSYDELYDWDLYFETVFLSYFGKYEFCRNGVEMFLDQQEPSGFVARTMGLVHPKPRQHFKPFLAQIALLGSRQSGDYRWLEGKYYERLKKYVDYWQWFCDFDGNGLSVWDSADHSGMDNQDLRCGELGCMKYEGVDLNCYIVRELEALSQIAAKLGLAEEAAGFAKQADELFARIDEQMWDEETGFYYDRNERTGELNKVLTISGLIPLWLGRVSKEKAERLVREHLLNPEEFWLEYPVATWAKTEKGYYQQKKTIECNWMGTAWIPTNYMVFHGLMKHGYEKEARELAAKTYSMVISEQALREYYNAENGCGQGLNPFWGWSSLGYVMPLEIENNYDPTEISCEDFIKLDGFIF